MRLTAEENLSLFKNECRWIDAAGNSHTVVTQEMASQLDPARCSRCGEDLNTYIELNPKKWGVTDKLSGKCQNPKCIVFGKNDYFTWLGINQYDKEIHSNTD